MKNNLQKLNKLPKQSKKAFISQALKAPIFGAFFVFGGA
jgi:hypothetical protein